ncbi:MAG: PIG-L family deacetylase [Parcubacteria group bacterium]|nr:PIG-L family deacetylase [Parcubacteria group bacterium]
MDKLYVYSAVKLPDNLPEQVILKQLPKNKKIVIISPHSDDVSIAMGGTVTILAKENTIIPVLFFTGYRGVADQDKKRATDIREQEMKQESKVLGIEEPIFMRLSSYDREEDENLDDDILQVEKVIKEVKPDLIFLPKKDDQQPRHRLAAQITLKALKNPQLDTQEEAKTPVLSFYENPWSLFDADEFNVVFVLPKRAVLKKMKAIEQHASQLARTPFDKASLSLVAFRGAVVPEQRIFGYGEEIGNKLDLYIEAFKFENL